MGSVDRRFLGSLRAAGLGAVICATAWSAPGCFVTIADPAVDSTGGKQNATTGGRQGSGGASSGGAEAGPTGGSGAREAGVESGPDACSPCSLQNVKTHGCNGASCTIVECEAGWVDCDGKPENGCETSFAVEAMDAMAGARAGKATIVVNGEGDDWSGQALYSMDRICTGCRSDQPGGQNGEPITNDPMDGPADLQAAFSLAWDASALYVYARIRDDQIVAADAANVERQDGIELLSDGDPNDVNNQYGPDVHHLFFGALAPAGSNVIERNQQLQDGDVKAATKKDAKCYFVEARLSWPYVMGRVPHTPAAGETHGFTIAVNDWDVPAGSEAGTHPVRQTQWFWVVPGVNYAYETTAFGTIVLGN